MRPGRPSRRRPSESFPQWPRPIKIPSNWGPLGAQERSPWNSTPDVSCLDALEGSPRKKYTTLSRWRHGFESRTGYEKKCRSGASSGDSEVALRHSSHHIGTITLAPNHWLRIPVPLRS